MIRREITTLGAASFALSGLCLLPAWDAILALPGSVRTWEPVCWLIFGTLVAWVVTIAAMGVGPKLGWIWRAVSTGIVAICIFETSVFLYVDIKNVLAMHLGPNYFLVRNIIAGLLVTGALGVCVIVWRLGVRRVVVKLTSALQILAPLPLVLIGAYFLGVKSGYTALVEGEKTNRTVVVLVFDELDETRVSADLGRLPNFAALRKNGLSASQMYPPANYTSESLPGILTGEIFQETFYSGNEVYVRHYGDSDWLRLSSRGNMIEDAVQRGSRTALIGWHLPYCAVVSRSVSCWDDASYRVPGGEVGLPEWMLGHSRLYSIYESRRLSSMSNNVSNYSREFLSSSQMYKLKRIGSIYENQKQQLLKALDSQSYDLVFAHIACPHPPSLVKTEVNQLDMFEAYARNLRECDGLLGSVMSRLQDGDYAKGYALVVTSDHWFRGLDWLDAGRPLVTPSHRRTVPFHVFLSDHQISAKDVDVITNSRVLRQFVYAASDPGFTLQNARQILSRQGDSPTAMRPF